MKNTTKVLGFATIIAIIVFCFTACGNTAGNNGNTLAEKLAALQTNATRGGEYDIEVTADENTEPTMLFYIDRNNITITILGNGEERTVSLLSSGSIFTVGSGVTLVLDSNITLKGLLYNTDSLVRVNDGGVLIMNTGSRITDNTVVASHYDVEYEYTKAGGVSVDELGIFIMNTVPSRRPYSPVHKNLI